MTEILFYHLERARLETVLPGLLEKTLAKEWKAVVRTGSRERAEALDNHLWTYRDDAFLPHASTRSADDAARQPIWLTEGEEIPNAADLLFLVDGAEADAGALNGFIRCVVIFDGGDDEAIGKARAFWKDAKDASHDATYWKQSVNGNWEKQA